MTCAAIARPAPRSLVPALAAALLLGGALVLLPPSLRAAEPPASYATVVKKAAPSVVTVSTSKEVARRQPMLPPQFREDPQLRRFFGFGGPGGPGDGDEGPRQRQGGQGSGVVLTADGYILTNHHVVDGANEIKVSLDRAGRPGGAREWTAKLVGSDPKTDIAVLKVEASDLVPIAIGDSDRVEVGDVVLAIGNPFGVGQTVTMGIISARGRGMGITDYEDFLQTDASINPGNSGGALVDAQGRLVGINTAIFSPNGGNLGIGFAVPVNLATQIKDGLVAHGKVVRGFLGLMIQPVSPEIAKAFQLPDTAGALVGDVVEDGPAGKAGIKAGDVVVEFDGKKVEDARALRLKAAATAPGTTVTLTLVRDGKREQVQVTLKDLAEAPGAPGEPAEAATPAKGKVGLALGALDREARRRLGAPESLEGALVNEVAPGSPAEAAGVRPGEVVVEVQRKPVKTPAEARAAIAEAPKETVLRLWSRGGMRYVVVEKKDG
jgi:serine protease Do